MVSNIICLHPYGRRNGLVQPPTRKLILFVFLIITSNSGTALKAARFTVETELQIFGDQMNHGSAYHLWLCTSITLMVYMYIIYPISYYHITMEFGGYLLNVAKKTTRARARKGEAQGVLSYQKAQEFSTTPIYIYIYMYIPSREHLGKRKIIFKSALEWDMLVSRRVIIYYIYIHNVCMHSGLPNLCNGG